MNNDSFNESDVHNKSDVQKVAENINPSEIEKNLNKSLDKSSDKTDVDTQPKPLNEDEETPFISDALRTDK